MSKKRLYIILIIAMLCVNVVLLFLLLGKPKPHKIKPEDRPKLYVIDKLGFNDDQIKKYENLIQKHWDDIAPSNNKILNYKEVLYKGLSDGLELDKIDSLCAGIGQEQSKIEQIHYDHFIEIKNLCSPNQIDDFTSLTEEINEVFRFNKKKL